jgi:hypothetical protein
VVTAISSVFSESTMSQAQPVIAIDNRPLDFPDPMTIVKLTHQAARAMTKIPDHYIRGVPLTDKSRSTTPYLWVKYGHSVRMQEARTQEYVWQALNGSPNAEGAIAIRIPFVYLAFRWRHCGYIVMDFINGTKCEDSDVPSVTAAVSSLISIRAPSAAPGLIGGGIIGNPFFIEWESFVKYGSVNLLQKHINNVSSLC